jgi:tRNA threonylcarbamoyladenosine biosynthesis protein TsaE
VIGLIGSLGAGKTRLTQSIGRGLGIEDGQIVSPTFTIAVPYQGRLPLLHLDAYRIGQPGEVDELGLDELAEEGVVLIIEWADRVLKLLPPLDLEIEIVPTGESSRLFRFRPYSLVGKRVLKGVAQQLDPSSPAD